MTSWPPPFALRNAITWNRRAISRARGPADKARHRANIESLEARLAPEGAAN